MLIFAWISSGQLAVSCHTIGSESVNASLSAMGLKIHARIKPNEQLVYRMDDPAEA
jgi:hypothetical protein